MEVTLALRDRAGLDQLIAEQQDPNSQQYHRWLSPAQFMARFGPDPQDAQAVGQWLTSQGFTVTSSSLEDRTIRFTGGAAAAEKAFATSIMTFGNKGFYSNVSEPSIPARFAGVIGAIGGLDNFIRITPLTGLSRGSAVLPPGAAVKRVGPWRQPEVKVGAQGPSFGPSDLYSFYDQTPLISAGIKGNAADCIAIVGVSDFLATAISAYNTQFGLPGSSITQVLADATDPGFNGAESEALLDLEWSHAVAPLTAQRYYLSASLIPAIQKAVTENKCSVISVSFSNCSTSGTFFTDTVDPIYKQAVTQGQSVFVSSGDDGAAGLIFDSTQGKCVIGTVRHVNELASPNVTSVGGTMFKPNFDAAGDNVGNVAESAWDDANFGVTGGATGGGASAFFAKPSYQTGAGVPADGQRDQPDIALIASANFPGAFIANDQTCDGGTCNGGGPIVFDQFGGTSLSAPVWGGFTMLIAQLKKARLGRINDRIYQMAAAGLAANGFRDVTSGNNDFNGVTGFAAKANYDQSTGWGSVDFNTFAHAFVGTPTPTPTPTPGGPTPTPTRTPQVTSHSYVINLAAPPVPGCANSAALALSGAALGDVCRASLSVPVKTGQVLGCFINAANQVTFRVCQFSGTPVDPDGGGATYRAVVAH